MQIATKIRKFIPNNLRVEEIQWTCVKHKELALGELILSCDHEYLFAEHKDMH